MNISNSPLPGWLAALETEDLNFIKRFVLASGSLKEMAIQYGVTYPTVRLRLDRLIDKIKSEDFVVHDPFIALVKQLVMNDKLDIKTAKQLITEYKKNTEK